MSPGYDFEGESQGAFHIGQRVRFENPEAPNIESDRNMYNTYLRGRVIYMDGMKLIQVIPDGKAFAFWLDLQKTEVLPE